MIFGDNLGNPPNTFSTEHLWRSASVKNYCEKVLWFCVETIMQHTQFPVSSQLVVFMKIKEDGEYI